MADIKVSPAPSLLRKNCGICKSRQKLPSFAAFASEQVSNFTAVTARSPLVFFAAPDDLSLAHKIVHGLFVCAEEAHHKTDAQCQIRH